MLAFKLVKTQNKNQVNSSLCGIIPKGKQCRQFLLKVNFVTLPFSQPYQAPPPPDQSSSTIFLQRQQTYSSLPDADDKLFEALLPSSSDHSLLVSKV